MDHHRPVRQTGTPTNPRQPTPPHHPTPTRQPRAAHHPTTPHHPTPTRQPRARANPKPGRFSEVLDYPALQFLVESSPEPSPDELETILQTALDCRGLDLNQAASLLQVRDGRGIERLLQVAGEVKQAIYGPRMVLFAPLYTSNHCSNACSYCGFRSDNTAMPRHRLSDQEVDDQVRCLLAQGHKRLLVLNGEARGSFEEILHVLPRIYAVRWEGQGIRRINVEIAPLEVEQFRLLSTQGIGTYTCFQETYDSSLYGLYHPRGPKADFAYRLDVMDRAMEGGIHDVGIGALFGLAEYRAEVLALLEHARHLEQVWGCGPHTISVPRLGPAPGAPLSRAVPHSVSDDQFKHLVAVLRLALPYTGIILSTRESSTLRSELFRYGVSQVSAGSNTAPGGYQNAVGQGEEESRMQFDPNHSERKDLMGTARQHDDGSQMQFALGDHRSLEQVIGDMVDQGFVPSFCTGCYRRGRVGQDFMDLAKPGLIRDYCLPNGLTSFAEYLEDFAGPSLRDRGYQLIRSLETQITPRGAENLRRNLAEITRGERDVYV